MNHLFFDTETNGLPKNYKGYIRDLDNWPRVIQLAWILFDDNGTEIDSRCSLIKPNGWTIPKEKFWLDNGYSTEKNDLLGSRMGEELYHFIEGINNAKVMIAHNLGFDLPIMAAEMIRCDMRAANKPKKYCTMKGTTNLCKLPGQYGYKWPKLEELHTYLFGVSFDGAHDALEDVKATARCFFELRDRGHLTELYATT
jgi:DNA polymerase III epsilon subunit-like protein